MTWKDGGDYGLLSRTITDETGNRPICRVWTRQFSNIDGRVIESRPEGEANFRLILVAPQMLEALEAIAALELGGCDPCKEIARAAIAAAKAKPDST